MRITDFNRPVIVNGMGYVKLFCNKQSPKVPRVYNVIMKIITYFIFTPALGKVITLIVMKTRNLG